MSLTNVILEPRTSVRVIYDEGRLTTNWEPVLPSETSCCDFDPPVGDPGPRAVYALALIRRHDVFLLAKDRADQSLRLKGTLVGLKNDKLECESSSDIHCGWWSFSIPAGRSLAKATAVTISTEVDGKPKELVKGSWKSTPVDMSSSTLPPVPTPPVAAAPSGQCRDPQVSQPTAGDTGVLVTFNCLPVLGVALSVDNDQPAGLQWHQPDTNNPFQLLATFTKPLLPYQWVKAKQPEDLNPDPLNAVVVADTNPPTPYPADLMNPWWVFNFDAANGCPPPAVAGKLPLGDTVVVTFPAPQGAACAPNPFQVRIFVDNKAVDVVSWSNSPDGRTFTARLSIPLRPFQRVKVLWAAPVVQNQPDAPMQGIVSGPAPTGSPAPPPNTITTGSCADPFIQNALGLTESVPVILGCLPNDPDKDLKLLVNGKAPDDKVTWSLTSMSPLTFTAKLTSKLKADDIVQVLQPGQRDPFSPAQIVSGPPKPPPATSVQAVQEGATSVTGTAQGLDKVRVKVFDGNYLRQQTDASVDSTTNTFTAALANPLQADQQLQLFGLTKSGTASDTATHMDVQPLALDWGRVRGYFTAGVILSNNNSQLNLTSANTFLDFNVDKDWLLPSTSFSQTGHGRFERLRFNTYFDARLTAIPTGTTGSSTSSSTPTLSAGSTTGTTGSTTGSTTPSSTTSGNPSPNTTSLLSNQQAAELQIGAYIPYTIDSWDFNERHYSLFVAPIAKVGFYTLTQSGSAANQAAENANRSNSAFFPFYSWGLRVGHRRDYSTDDGRTDRNRAPEQLSYLDVSVGKWSNLEYLQPFNYTTAVSPTCTMPATDPTTAACDVRERLWRYGFEGLLIIPNTPLFIGLSANVSAQHPKGPPGSFFLSPPDDLRFLFGIRFDASKLTGALGKLGGP